jgi:hypothetical protein
MTGLAHLLAPLSAVWFTPGNDQVAVRPASTGGGGQ